MGIGYRIRAAFGAAVVILFVALCYAGQKVDVSETASGVYADVALRPEGGPALLRLHVIANSDEAEDQRVKLLVRDALLATFAPTKSLEQAETVLLERGGEVQKTVERVLQENGCGYGCQLLWGVVPFPQRVYGETVYPAGEYEALRVVLGKGEGKNWWCILFPPLCLADIGVTDLLDTDEIQWESALANWLNQ